LWPALPRAPLRWRAGGKIADGTIRSWFLGTFVWSARPYDLLLISSHRLGSSVSASTAVSCRVVLLLLVASGFL
jgi:hypothetical protein